MMMPVWFDGSTLSTVAPTVLAVLFDLTLKGAALLALAGVLTALLRNASAATRHLVWCLALCSLLLLPVLTVCLPAWRLSILAAIPYIEEATAPLSRPFGAIRPSEPEAMPVALGAPPSVPMTTAVAPAAGYEQADEEPTVLPEGIRPTPAALFGVFAGWYQSVRGAPWTSWLLGLWIFGVGVVLFRLLLGAAGVAWLAYRAQTIRDTSWRRLTDEVCRDLRLRRRVLLLRSRRTAMPMTWGMKRPILLLPAQADAWSQERRRCVLTHELAHIKRWDCLTQTLAQGVCALSWFNPLVWIAARKLRHERELACDDYVLTQGVRPSVYATHLLEIARTTRSTFVAPLGAVAMAQASQLEGRVLAILDIARRRDTLHRFVLGAAVALTGLLLVPLAAMRPADPNPALIDAMPSIARIVINDGPAYAWTGYIEPGKTLDIRGIKGHVQVTPTSEKAVQIVVIPRDDTFAGKVLIVKEEEGLVVCLAEPTQPETCSADTDRVADMAAVPPVDFVASVPVGIAFTGRTQEGNVTVIGLQREVRVATKAGDIFVRAGGFVEALTEAGDIRLHTTTFGRARTLEGDIHARIGHTSWEGALPFYSRKGDVTIELPEDAHADIDLRVEAAGRLASALPLQQHPWAQGERLRGTLGSGGRRLTIHTVDGNITIAHRGARRTQAPEHFDVRKRDDIRQDVRERSRYRAQATTKPNQRYAAARPTVPDETPFTARAATSPPVALSNEPDMDADLATLRRRISHLNRSLRGSMYESAARAINALDLGLEVDERELANLVHTLDQEAGYVGQLKALGLEVFTREELVLARLVGIDAVYIGSVRRAGYCPSLKELVQMKVAGIDQGYIRDLAAEGYETLPVKDLVELRKSGIDRGVIHEMEEHGIHTPTVEEMVEYGSSHGPMPD